MLYTIRMLIDSKKNIFIVAEDILQALGCSLQYRDVTLHCTYNKLDLTLLRGVVEVSPVNYSQRVYYFSWDQLQQVRAKYRYNPYLVQLIQHILQECKTVLNRKII